MLTQYVQPFTTWLHLHPYWAIAFAFLVAFLESIAIIGTIVPGSVTLTAVGVLIGAGVIPTVPTLIWAIIGAIAGDTLSYWIGAHYHSSIKTRWPLKHYPGLIKSGETFLSKHGGKSIFIGRFVGPIRSILPLVVGMLQMPFRRFFIADVISGIFWAPSYMLPGILIGAASLELSPEAASRLIMLILLTLVVIWLAHWLLQITGRYLLDCYDQLTARLWHYLTTHRRTHWISTLLQNPAANHDHGQLFLGMLVLIGFISFFCLAINVKIQGLLTAWNLPVFHLFQSLRTPQLDNIVVAFTFLGDKTVLLSFLIVLSAWFVVQKNYRLSLYWFLNGAVTAFSIKLFKVLVQSPRPTGLAVLRDGFSFPSGHSTLAVAILGFLAYLFSKQVAPRYRIWVLWLMGTVISFILLSRLYLGAHWLSDIIGSLLLGLSIMTTTIIAYQRQSGATIPLFKTAAVSLLALATLTIAINLHRFEKQRSAYSPKTVEQQLSFERWWQQKQPILPLYRYARTGAAVENLNLQWLGDIAAIEKTLKAAGWQSKNNASILTVINRLLSKDKTQVLPVLTQLFRNQDPALVMTKKMSDKRPLLILHLWDAKTHIDKHPQPLWIGVIQYRIIWKHRWVNKHGALIKDLVEPHLLLLPDLKKQKTRTVYYPETEILKPPRITPERAEVLLIQQ